MDHFRKISRTSFLLSKWFYYRLTGTGSCCPLDNLVVTNLSLSSSEVTATASTNIKTTQSEPNIERGVSCCQICAAFLRILACWILLQTIPWRSDHSGTDVCHAALSSKPSICKISLPFWWLMKNANNVTHKLVNTKTLGNLKFSCRCNSFAYNIKYPENIMSYNFFWTQFNELESKQWLSFEAKNNPVDK